MSEVDFMEKQERAAQRKFLWIAASVWLALAVISCLLYLRKGIYVGGDFLYRSGSDCYRGGGTEINMVKEGDTVRFEALRDGRETNAVLTWLAPADGKYRQVNITFQNGTVIEASWDGAFFTGADGRPLFLETQITVSINGKRPPLSKATWGAVFCRLASGETETRGSVLFLFLGTIGYVLSAAGFLFPDEVHFFLRRWQYVKPELSDEGRFVAKISAIVGMILSGVMMLHLFLLLV